MASTTRINPGFLLNKVISVCITIKLLHCSLLQALYGCFFHDNQEAAFSNYRLWESLGALTAFAYSQYLCVSVKLYILMAKLTLAFALYLVSELVNKKQVESYALEENTIEMDSIPVGTDEANMTEANGVTKRKV